AARSVVRHGSAGSHRGSLRWRHPDPSGAVPFPGLVTEHAQRIGAAKQHHAVACDVVRDCRRRALRGVEHQLTPPWTLDAALAIATVVRDPVAVVAALHVDRIGHSVPARLVRPAIARTTIARALIAIVAHLAGIVRIGWIGAIDAPVAAA